MDLEFVQCRTKRWVPIANGILLHSSVDPEREAAQLVEREWASLSGVKSILVMGLGGGFHLEELARRHDGPIVVIEAEKEMAQAMAEKNPELMGKIEVLAGVPPAQIPREEEIISVLSASYSVFKHPASFRISQYYYTAVMQTLNDRTLRRLRQLSAGNTKLQQFLDSLSISNDQILTLPMVEEAMARRGQGLEREGLIWMTLRELVV
jgi:hypothetical protein